MPSNRNTKPATSSLADAAALIDVRPPAQELRALVAARVETLAKLGQSKAGGSSSLRLELYRDALGYATRLLADARARPDAARDETLVLPLRDGAYDEPAPSLDAASGEATPADGGATTIMNPVEHAHPTDDHAAEGEQPSLEPPPEGGEPHDALSQQEPRALSAEEASRLLLGLNEPELDIPEEAAQ